MTSFAPYHPERYGVFMASAYETSSDLGQLAVTHILELCRPDPDDGFQRTEPAELTEAQKEDWEFVCKGGSINNLIARVPTVNSYGFASKRLRSVYGSLGVRTSIAAIRLAYEEQQIDLPMDGLPPVPQLELYDMVAFDLRTRGLTREQIARLTGDAPITVSKNRIPRVLRALRIHSSSPGRAQTLSREERWAQAIGSMYGVGIFRPGWALLSTLRKHPEVVVQFREQLQA